VISNNRSPLTFINDIQTEAARLGFIFMGVTSPQTPAHYGVYETWLAEGRHGSMAYLETERARLVRRRPELAFPGTSSILSLAFPYPQPPVDPGPTRGRVAAYARLPDYHLTIPPRLDALRTRIEAVTGQTVQARAYTDTGPILERELAMQSGLGWIGKNTCLINPSFGSYFFLAELFTTARLPRSESFTHDRCGSCRRCIEACPTGCILPDRTIDARRCISYLTIENKGVIPPDLRSAMGNWIFGCDVCQIVCPWNRFYNAQTRPQEILPALMPSPILKEELGLTPQEFNQKFKTSPVQRPRRRGYLRNIAVALGNSADPGGVEVLGKVLFDEAEPLVRGHCAWALGCYRENQARTILSRAVKQENDAYVLSEITAALEGQGTQAGKAASSAME
jgi:epoxyqueuosine reductase